MPITFGSVGDIIAVCLIVKDLVDALDNLRGSAAEYQEIIRELGNLEHALRQVEDLSRLFADSIEMTTLLLVAAQAVDNCKSTVNGFRDKIRKFDKSLAVNGTDNIARKVQWHVTRKEELVKFRAKVGEHCLALKMSMGYVQM